MARYKDLGSWRAVQIVPETTTSPPRRTRRATHTASSQLSLSRESDQTNLSVGDAIFVGTDLSGNLNFLSSNQSIEKELSSRNDSSDSNNNNSNSKKSNSKKYKGSNTNGSNSNGSNSKRSTEFTGSESSSPGFFAVITSLEMDLSGIPEMWVLPLVSVKMVEDEKGDEDGKKEEIAVSEMVLVSKNIRVDISKITRKEEIQSQSQYQKGQKDQNDENGEKDQKDSKGKNGKNGKKNGSKGQKHHQNTQKIPLFCCRATDIDMNHVSDPFDYVEWVDLLKKDSARAVFSIREKTSVIVSPRKRAASELSEKRTSPRKKVSYVEISSGSEAEFEDSDNDDDDDDDDDDSDDSELDPETVVTPRKKRNPQTPDSKSRQISPRKNRDSAKRTDVFQQVVNVLSPVNKGFKIKSGIALSRLPSFSRETSDVSDQPESPASDAFRELKERLHTSARLAHLPCREEQFDELYMNLESAIMQKMGTTFYISGTPGVGKTATIREVVAALRDNVQTGYVDEFDFLEINSLKLLSPDSAYEKLWDHLTGIKVTPSNAALLLEEYFSRGEDIKKPLIILMDELDQLVTNNQKVIYNFFNWPTYSQSKLIVLAVANTMDLPERVFSNKIASRLGLRRMAFRGYTEEELGTIIQHRLKMLSETNKRIVEVTPDAMRFASKRVAIVSGDARRALTICKRAVEIAEREFLDTENTAEVPEDQQKYSVRIDHIGMAIAQTVNSPTSRFLSTLSFASKLLLVSILLRMRRSERWENTLGDVMDEMKNTLSLDTKASPLLGGLGDDTSVVSLLYGGGDGGHHVRMHHINYIVNELVDQGILMQQNVRSERHRTIALHISEDEVGRVLRKDKEVGHLI